MWGVACLFNIKMVQIEKKIKRYIEQVDQYYHERKVIEIMRLEMERLKVELKSAKLKHFLLVYPPIGQKEKNRILEMIEAYEGAINYFEKKGYPLSLIYSKWANRLFGNIYKPEKDFKVDVAYVDYLI